VFSDSKSRNFRFFERFRETPPHFVKCGLTARNCTPCGVQSQYLPVHQYIFVLQVEYKLNFAGRGIIASMRQRRGRHTTVIEGLEPVLRELERYPQIQVSFGLITTGLPTGRHILKFRQLSGGVQAVFRGTRTKQVIYLYGDGELIEKVLLAQTSDRLLVIARKPVE